MIRKKIILLMSFILSFSLAFSQDLKTSSNLLTGELSNGMKYYILKNEKPENRASLNLVVKSGSLSEKDNQLGLAHFLEHMAFNGTEKYKKNDLIKYLQSLGLSFGGDLNAYTSFEETVYELKVPTTEKDLEVAMDVLYQWSDKITLNQKDINDEKNIIMEEWRLSQGIKKRLGDIQKKILFGDSFYSKRFPIGEPEIIKSATRDNLLDYYKNNYQPKNMSIIAVGDFNKEEVKNIIEKTFSSLKNTKEVKNSSYSISPKSKNTITFFTDPEITNTNINIMWKYKTSPLNTYESYKQFLIEGVLNSIMNSRFADIALEKTSPFVYSSLYNFSLNKNTGVYASSSLIKNDNIKDTTDIIFKNLKDISLNGVTESELEKEITNIINASKLAYNNRDSITNSSYLTSIREQVLNDNTFLNAQDDFKISTELLKSISTLDIKKQALDIINSNYDILITSNKDINSIITKDQLKNIIKNIKKDNSIKLNLSWKPLVLNSFQRENGKITKEIKKDNLTEFKLSNGLDVLFKETDFDKDKIMITLTKGVGNSNLSFKEFLNSKLYPTIISSSGVSNIDYKNLNNYFKGKNFSVSPFITDYSQGFNIVTDKENLNEALKYFTASIFSQNISEDILQSTLTNYKELIKNQNNSPFFNFKETYSKILNNNNPRKKALSLENLKEIDIKTLKKLHENMIDFKGYKISIVGSIDENSVKNILEKYFANLPTSKNSIKVQELGIKYPTNIIKEEVIKGVDKKATVVLTFPYHGEITKENSVLYKGTSSLLNILLLENIREKNGGVYSISSFANIDKLNYGEDYLQIYFSTDPKKVNQIINEVINTMTQLQKGDFDKEKILDIQKNYKLSYETALKTNGFWLSYLIKKNLITDYEFYTPIMYNDSVNYNSIVSFSKKAIDLKNYVEVILLPQREE